MYTACRARNVSGTGITLSASKSTWWDIFVILTTTQKGKNNGGASSALHPSPEYNFAPQINHNENKFLLQIYNIQFTLSFKNKTS